MPRGTNRRSPTVTPPARSSRQARPDPHGSRKSLAGLIELWFRRSARDLPWRGPAARSGYSALVSETLAQQTQMSRVVVAYQRFMERFPTVRHLARAEEQQVLAAWNGLGYYRRALHLHAAAQEVVDRFDGEVPSDPLLLRSLPGVGRYTAGAIASIAFDRPTPLVDGNVGRVLMRLHGRPGSVDEPDNSRWLWEEAERLVLAASSPAALNEGLMELGAIVCTPMAPRCGECPLQARCVARREHSVDAIPAPKRRATVGILHQHAVVSVRRGRILVEQRPEQGLWARMWQAPTIESSAALDLADLAKRARPAVSDLRRVGSFVHRTTHREVRVAVYRADAWKAEGRWIAFRDLPSLAMGGAARRAIAIAMQ